MQEGNNLQQEQSQYLKHSTINHLERYPSTMPMELQEDHNQLLL